MKGGEDIFDFGSRNKREREKDRERGKERERENMHGKIKPKTTKVIIEKLNRGEEEVENRTRREEKKSIKSR